MTGKAQHILEKLALDFGTTRGLVRAFKAGGGKLTRLMDESSSYMHPLITGTLTHTINIPRNASNPRSAFFHEMGHFLDLRKGTEASLRRRDMLVAEQKANVIARRSIVNPEHRKSFEQIAEQNFASYKTYAGGHPKLKRLSEAERAKKYPVMFRDAFGRKTK